MTGVQTCALPILSVTDFDHTSAAQQTVSTWAAMRDQRFNNHDEGHAVDLDRVFGL